MKQRTRLWIALALLLAALLVLGVVLQAFNQLIWQLSAVLPYGLVGPVALLLVLAAAALLGQLLWPLLQGWLPGRRRDAAMPGAGGSVAAPANRREAASRQLEAIDQTLERVRDTVARQALAEQRRRMEAELQRGDLVVVLFGSGSVGKTSLIRALLQELVGEVGAAMGSTTGSRRYRLRLRGLERGIWLVDTPGILEA